MEAASGGDVDYATVGTGYAARRRPDPTIAASIERWLGSADTVLNVGAGSGSYEPVGRRVIALEPSAAMIGQRPPTRVPVVRGVAGALPMADRSMEAAMAVLTVHQWPDVEAGLHEMRRVTAGPVVVLTFDPAALDRLWLCEYVPELHRVEASRYPPIATIAAALGPEVAIRSVPVPLDCPDGFSEAFYGRPEAFLDPDVRRAQSAWSFVAPDTQARFEATLEADLTSGRWDHRHGHLRSLPTFDGAVRLVIGH
jgi:hypothetical protein